MGVLRPKSRYPILMEDHMEFLAAYPTSGNYNGRMVTLTGTMQAWFYYGGSWYQVGVSMDDIDSYMAPLTDAGAADAYEITSGRSLTAYSDGQTFWFVVGNTNTGGAVTLDVDSIGPASVVRAEDGENPFPGQMTAGAVVGVKYDADNTRFVLILSDQQGVAIDTATVVASGSGAPSNLLVDLSSVVPAGANWVAFQWRGVQSANTFEFEAKPDGHTNPHIYEYFSGGTTLRNKTTYWCPLSSDRKIRITATALSSWELLVVGYH
jgi:hypothetical protein